MARRFGSAEHPDAQVRAAKALCLAPCADADAALTRDLSEKATSAPMGEDRVGWFRLTRALADYRAGDDAGCVRSLEQFWPEGKEINFGDRRYPKGAARLLAECPRPGKRDLGVGPDNWVVWAILHREAEQALAGRVAPDAN